LRAAGRIDGEPSTPAAEGGHSVGVSPTQATLPRPHRIITTPRLDPPIPSATRVTHRAYYSVASLDLREFAGTMPLRLPIRLWRRAGRREITR